MNRCGAKLPSFDAGTWQLSSTSALDTGDIWIAYKSGGDWVTDLITLDGQTPVFGDAGPIDEDSPWFAQSRFGIPIGNVAIACDDDLLAMMWGSVSGVGAWNVDTFTEIAVATAQDAAISATDRETDPASGIGSFGRATFWPGEDDSIAIPDDDLDATHYIGYCVRVTFPANCPKPPGSSFLVKVDLIGDPDDTEDADIIYYFGDDGNPATGAIGGAIDDGTPINEATANNLIDNPKISTTEKSYRGIAYRANEAA